MNSSADVPMIHVVDDDAGFRAAVSRVLRAAGYEVRAYASAAEFLLSVDNGRRGCILLDIQMPGHSGVELQAALAARANSLPIILLSGGSEISAWAAEIKAGGIEFLSKPVDLDTLNAAIHSALARRCDLLRSSGSTST